MMAVYLKELRSYFTGVLGWLFAAFLTLFAGIYTMVYSLTNGSPDFELVISSITFIYMIGVPILTMRSVAEEKHSRTDQLLYALPVKLSHIVMGKYLALCTVLLLPVCVIGLYPLFLMQFGALNLKLIYTTLMAFFLLGAALLSVGLFISSLTESQVAAAVLTLVAMLILYFISSLATFVPNEGRASLIALCAVVALFALILLALTRNSVVALLVAAAGTGGLCAAYMMSPAGFTGLFAKIMGQLSLFDRFDVFANGILDLTGVVYFLSVSGVFLFLTVQSLEKRRWS